MLGYIGRTIIITTHITICIVLGVLFNEEKCKRIYEYYSPWGRTPDKEDDVGTEKDVAG